MYRFKYDRDQFSRYRNHDISGDTRQDALRRVPQHRFVTGADHAEKVAARSLQNPAGLVTKQVFEDRLGRSSRSNTVFGTAPAQPAR